jgi:hypothetical protein
MNRKLIKTKSNIYLRPRGLTRIGDHPLHQSLNLKQTELLISCKEPILFETLIEAGFEERMIESLLAMELLELLDSTSTGINTIWQTYNMHRAAFLMFSAPEKSADVANKKIGRTQKRTQTFIDSLQDRLHRRTERFFSRREVQIDVLYAIIEDLGETMIQFPWITIRILVQGINGLKPGIYSYDLENHEFIQQREGYSRKALQQCVHGQWWVGGSGFCVFFLVSFPSLGDTSFDSPLSYKELLIQLGHTGQALVDSATRNQLGCWMTPAVSESLAAEFLGICSENHEVMYFFKVGLSEQKAIEERERRSPI